MENKSKDTIRDLALEKIKGIHRAGLGISMGIGKTLIGLSDMVINYSPDATFLVVGPKNKVKDTWLEEADKYNLSYLKDKIKFTTYLSLGKQLNTYTKVYLDECHSLKFNHELWLNFYHGPILGLTGTPPVKKFSEKGKMVAKYCPIVYTYITDDAVEDQLLNDYRIYVHYAELNKSKTIQRINKKTKSPFYVSEYDTYNYWCKMIDQAETQGARKIAQVMRMKALQSFTSKEVKAKELMREITSKCIIFCDTTDQADRLCTSSYHTNNPRSEENLEDFKAGNSKFLSCVLQLSEGVNIPGLKESIIMHSYGNERKFAQRFGRNLRLMVGDMATIHILCYAHTIDEEWVAAALKPFNEEKIILLDHEI